MGSNSHLKRLNMPRSWPLSRKTTTWIVRPLPGGHPLDMGMPLGPILRDVLGVAQTMREVRVVLSTGQIKVDGRVVKETRRIVGLMDVLTVGEQNYRCILDLNGRLRYRPIKDVDSSWKIGRIDGKVTIRGGMTQYRLHDGRNLLHESASEFSVGDSVVISIPEQEVLEHLPFSEDGSTRAYIIGGSHAGKTALIQQRIIKRSSQPNEVNFEDFGTHARHVMVISDSRTLPIEVTT